jgi:hypothetical protein
VARATGPKFAWTLLALAASGSLAGCGTMANGRRWGGDVTFLPSGKQLGRAAWNALKHPLTWAPIAGAAVLQIDDWDQRISDWAMDETPLFGSIENAKDARGWTGTLSDYVYFASVAATPSGEGALDWGFAKAKGLAVGAAARYSTFFAVDRVLKPAFPRDRPDGSDDRSFPSQHAANLSVNATLTSSNLHAMTAPSGLLWALDAGSIGLATAGSWSRVEAGGHFPSDVLVGAAFGHFVGQFFEEAFLGLDAPAVDVQPVATRDLIGISFSLRF